MFILTNIDVKTDRVQILDTSDLTNDIVSLGALSKKIRGNRFKVYGLKRQNNNTDQNLIIIPELGIAIDQREAREALARFYMENGLDKVSAYKKAGLS